MSPAIVLTAAAAALLVSALTKLRRRKGEGMPVCTVSNAHSLEMLANNLKAAANKVDNSASEVELALNGFIRPVRGVLPIARHLSQDNEVTLIVPPANVREAQLVGAARLAAPPSLGELVNQLRRRALSRAVERQASVRRGRPRGSRAPRPARCASRRAGEAA